MEFMTLKNLELQNYFRINISNKNQDITIFVAENIVTFLYESEIIQKLSLNTKILIRLYKCYQRHVHWYFIATSKYKTFMERK